MRRFLYEKIRMEWAIRLLLSMTMIRGVTYILAGAGTERKCVLIRFSKDTEGYTL